MSKWQDRVIFSITTRLVFVHLFCCLGAILSPFIIGMQAWEIWSEVKLAKTLVQEGDVLEIERLNPDQEYLSSTSGRYHCFLQFDGWEYEAFLPSVPPAGPTLKIYSHQNLPALPAPDGKIVVVPQNPTVSSVYFEIYHHTLKKRLIIFAILLLVFAIVIYIAIKGYIMIKGGGRSRRKHRRH